MNKRIIFRSEWEEILYLYHEIIDWWYGNKKGWKKYISNYILRLEKLLQKVASKHEAIKGEECWSLVHEFKGNLEKAIEYREGEIKLMKKFLKSPESKIIKDIDYTDVHDRLILLSILYNKMGNNNAASKSLKEAKKLADKKKFPFEAQDLIDEFSN